MVGSCRRRWRSLHRGWMGGCAKAKVDEVQMPQFIRFDERFLRMLRAAVDLPGLIGQDLPLRPVGRSFKACCPFHGEKTPSFTVGKETGFYRCFGCGATGDAIEWLKARHGMTFHDAALHLAKVSGVPLPPAAPV